MDFKKILKDVVWTEGEVMVLVAGAAVATQVIPTEVIFKKHFEKNPEWFHGKREHAPWFIKWAGAGKALTALAISTQVKNPWIKLGLMGFALQGTIEQARVMTYKEEEGGEEGHHWKRKGLQRIGENEKLQELDAKLKEAAQMHRINAPEYLGAPDYINGSNMQVISFVPNGDKFESAVAGFESQGTRHESGVAGSLFTPGSHHWSTSDDSEAF